MIPEENLAHPSFKQPQDVNARVWRYMDFAKFVSMIQTSCFVYTRIDQFQDNYEGRISNSQLNLIKQAPTGEGLTIPQFIQLCSKGMRSTYANCWCLQDHESDALWKIYTKGLSGGVAICSTYSKLINNLTNIDLLGMVKYIDYSSEMFSPGNGLNFIMHKRKQYSYESEVRIVRMMPKALEEDALGPNGNNENMQAKCIVSDFPVNTKVEVDLSSIIEKVIVSPYSPNWLYGCIKNITCKYGYDFEVVNSTMADPPVGEQGLV